MENVILVIHLILALALIGVVMLQRSEGGALLSGGGNTAGRSSISGLAKITWGLAAAFITTSIALTVIAASNSANTSVLDRIGGRSAPVAEAPVLPGEGSLLPPPAEGDPLTPPRAD